MAVASLPRPRRARSMAFFTAARVSGEGASAGASTTGICCCGLTDARAGAEAGADRRWSGVDAGGRALRSGSGKPPSPWLPFDGPHLGQRDQPVRSPRRVLVRRILPRDSLLRSRLLGGLLRRSDLAIWQTDLAATHSQRRFVRPCFGSRRLRGRCLGRVGLSFFRSFLAQRPFSNPACWNPVSSPPAFCRLASWSRADPPLRRWP